MAIFDSDQLKTLEIFFPYALARHTAVLLGETRFVHYTSASVALEIIRNKEVWMRKTTCMNDYSEVVYGFECLASAYNSKETGTRFRELLDSLFDGFCASLQDLVNGWRGHFVSNSYITCFSEHDDAEDAIGRLSMWRAYGSTTGVAFVINNGVFLRPSDALKAYTSPVAYLSPSQFEAQLASITDNIEKNKDFIQRMGRDYIFNTVFEMFRYGGLCNKHPGFKEEREWRVIYSPSYDKSERLTKDTQVINGIPQPIYKIKLENFPDEGFYGAEIPDLLSRIIIGPTQFGGAIREAFIEALTDAGVADPNSKVWVSDIPLR